MRAETWLADTRGEGEDLRHCGVQTYSVEQHMSTWNCYTHQNLRAETWLADTPGEAEDIRHCGELPVYTATGVPGGL